MSTDRKNFGISALLLTLYFKVVNNFKAKKLETTVHKCTFPHFTQYCFLRILATDLPSIIHDCIVGTSIKIKFTVILSGKEWSEASNS
jgi:hypothetical protein